jgi:dynein heavy chain
MDLPALEGFAKSFVDNLDKWFEFINSPEAPENLPSPWDKLSDFQVRVHCQQILTSLKKLIVLRSLRSNKLTFALSDYVAKHLGPSFIRPPPLNLEKFFKESTPNTPLIFILTPGSDPTESLLQVESNLII